MKIKRILPWLLRIAAAILFFGGLFGLLNKFGSGGLFLPTWTTWEEEDRFLTIDQEDVHLQLKNRCLKFTNPGGELLWVSDRGWKVSQVWVWDIDHDQADEVIMLVWKKGSFGDHKPFWIEENDEDWSQHIFIYDWDHARDDRLKPIWMSSALGIKAAQAALEESTGKFWITTPDGVRTSWYWDSWGLLRID